jgi:oxygen-dependent protoporphyrinogen oxidase
MIEEEPTDVLIIGAGISGLACAAWLQSKGLRVTVLESSEKPGGVMRSEQHKGFLIETGPNSLLETSPRIAELIELAGLQHEMIVANDRAKKRYIMKNGALLPLPLNPIAFLRTPLFSLSAKLRLLREPFVAPLLSEEDESIAAFVRRRLGNEFLDYAIDPFVAGVYAGDPENLSVSAAFPKLKALETKYGSLIRGAIRGRKERGQREEKAKNIARMISFRGGLGQLTAALASRLRRRICYKVSPRIERDPMASNWRVRFEEHGRTRALRASHVVITAPADRLREITIGALAQACRPFSEIPYAPIAVVTAGCKREHVKHPLDGFGYLVPRKEGRKILGMLWNSSIFPERAPEDHVLTTTFMGGARQPELALLPEEELIAFTIAELQLRLGVKETPAFVHVRKYARAIPQYAIGHQRWQRLMDQIEIEYPGLHFAVNYRDGVSVSDCIVRSHRMAEAIAKEMSSWKGPSLELDALPSAGEDSYRMTI